MGYIIIICVRKSNSARYKYAIHMKSNNYNGLRPVLIRFPCSKIEQCKSPETVPHCSKIEQDLMLPCSKIEQPNKLKEALHERSIWRTDEYDRISAQRQEARKQEVQFM